MWSRAWAFLRDEGNRGILAFLGGGAVVVIGGLWAAFTFFYEKGGEKPAQSQTIEVHNGNVIGSGPNATFNAPVTINPDAKEAVAPINERLDKLAAEVAREKGVEVAPLLSVLAKLGEKSVREEDIPKRLDAAADELIKLRAEIDRLRAGPPALAAVAAEAQALIDKGDLDGARHALERGREAARTERVESSRFEAGFLAQEARVDDLQIAYRSAAAKYAEAAALVASFDPQQQWRLLTDQASELYKQGYEFGEDAALLEAIDVYQRSLALSPRSERPRDWAMTENDLGVALKTLGERQAGTGLLDEAASAFRSATEEMTRDDAPLQWAMARNNLGATLEALGARETGTARLEEAATVYRDVLKEFAGEKRQWATAQNNLGGVLTLLGQLETGTARLAEAVAAYHEALTEFTREGATLEQAMTQNNLGIALQALALRQGDAAPLEEAVAAYRAALQEFTRERTPLKWAAAQSNLGGALAALGAQENGTTRLDEAVSAYREALKEQTHERSPLQWAANQVSLASVHIALFAKDRQPRHLDDALEAVDGAAEEYRKAQSAGDREKAERLQDLRKQIVAVKDKA